MRFLPGGRAGVPNKKRWDREWEPGREDRAGGHMGPQKATDHGQDSHGLTRKRERAVRLSSGFG